MTDPRRSATGAPAADPDDPIPQDWAAWRHCIEVQCGIPLTAAYVAGRLRILADPAQEETQRFIKSWGQAHRERVVGWFQRAAASLANDADAATGARRDVP